MTQSLNVQRDDVGQVVRLLSEEGAIELSPDHAEALGEALIRAGRELQTTQSTLAAEPSGNQSELSGASEQDREPVEALLEEVDEDPPEPGEIINDTNPADW